MKEDLTRSDIKTAHTWTSQEFEYYWNSIIESHLCLDEARMQSLSKMKHSTSSAYSGEKKKIQRHEQACKITNPYKMYDFYVMNSYYK